MSQNDLPTIPGYRIENEAGRGGMATVYLAVQESLERRVALKVMKAALAADEEFAERFVREARTAANLQHPGIVAIHDTGNVGHHSYIAMEYITGGELNARLKHGTLDLAQALRITREIADALDYAHEKGFVHRDVKPENILFREKGNAVLTDFGVARAAGTSTRLTGTGLSIGTPHYMSPEQARGDDVDGRSDLYALGIVLHEMLTGQVPFDARDSLAIGIKHLQAPIPHLPDHLKQFQAIIDKLLAKDPDDRYQTGAELIEDLERVEQGEKLRPKRAGTRFVKKSNRGSEKTDQGSSITDRGKDTEEGSRAGVYWGLGGAALAGVLAIGIYIWQDQTRSTPPVGGGPTIVSRPVTEPVEPLDLESPPAEPRTLKPEPLPSGTAILHVTTTPEGAEIYLGEDRLGETPFQSDELPEGEHRLRLAHRHYEPWEQTVELENDVVERIEADLQRGTGRVTVITDPPGAEIWIDDQPIDGTTPLTLGELIAGEQELEIRLPRYRTETHEVEILPGETARLDFALEGSVPYEWEDHWPALQPVDTFRDCPDCPRMAMIPGGRFTMGSPSNEPQRLSREGPQRHVNVPDFALGTTPVTFAEWDACMADGGCSHRPDDEWGRSDHPVMRVNWNDAQEFVRWLSRKTGEEYRLPSEAEWEYAARAGTTTRFNTGNCITTDQANFDGTYPAQGCPRGEVRGHTTPVKSFAPNAWGLYDMHGNVWEWVEDCWNDNYNGAPTDGSAWMSGDCGGRVVRGGYFFNDGGRLRSAYRGSMPPSFRGIMDGGYFFGGFRVARSVTP